MVLGGDGKEYGPVNVDTLRTWVSEGRVQKDTQLRDFATGSTMQAGQVAGLFATATPVQLPSMQHNPKAEALALGMNKPNDNDMGIIIGVVLRSVAAVILFFVFHGIGLAVGGYALYYAIQAKNDGHKNGTIAIVIASSGGCSVYKVLRSSAI